LSIPKTKEELDKNPTIFRELFVLQLVKTFCYIKIESFSKYLKIKFQVDKFAYEKLEVQLLAGAELLGPKAVRLIVLNLTDY